MAKKTPSDTYAAPVDPVSPGLHHGDGTNPDLPVDFDRIVDAVMSRRAVLGRGVAFGAAAFVMGTGCIVPRSAHAASRLTFDAVTASTADTVSVPAGHSWHVVARWGDPLWSKGQPFDGKTMGTGESQMLAFGDNVDGMELFSSGTTTLLAVNNEYTNLKLVFADRDGRKPASDDDVRKCMAAHGVSVIEVAQKDGKWAVVKDSKYNRRITPTTPMEITGPARGNALMKTASDPTGTTCLGTWNNCGAGRTPWGTFLTCEENFNGYFASSDAAVSPPAELKRYGIKVTDAGYSWIKNDERFDISKHPNEANRFGYVVEIDPMDPTSKPKKLTALGRLKHENAAVTVANNGHVVVYMGDDERGEFVYRFVSEGKYVAGGDNRNLLENGKLYVARFGDDMTGEWVELTPASTGMASQADVCIRTRQAGSAVKATTMDRPEWVAVNPLKPEVYLCLTNNSQRGKRPNAGGDATPATGPNPRAGNNYGQIVRWRPDNGDHTAARFNWDFFVLAGNPTVHNDRDKGVAAYAGSKNITHENMFNSPDGMAFDSRGLLWIQTDGNDSNTGEYAGMGNNQMLVGDPETGEIRRFLVGPVECEVTGIAWSPDKKTVFVGIQHPGDEGKGASHWPDGGDSTPRSAVIAITRNDGGVLG